MATVDVQELRKVFKVPVRETGLRNSLRSLFKREHRMVEAVRGVSFSLEPGEIVGFLGPNGAGKTTTLKMLSGLLYPDGGVARVLGFRPERRDAEFLRRVALIMGNRNSLQWDLPVADSLELRKAIYEVDRVEFDRRISAYTEMLDVGELLTKPVRNLSLGERMKVEILASLVPHPQVLFLDEPTIGLDITMQKRIREFVRVYAAETGASVLLTSHYMADVTALAERVIVIHHGNILFDGGLAGLSDRFTAHKTIVVSVAGELGSLTELGRVVEQNTFKATLEVARDEIAAVAARLLAEYSVTDLSISDPPIEDVIEQAFAIGDVQEAEEAGESRL
ncbi:MAG TPA: ATP-binding cassette domain-containing protein [Acidimicrobiia bacterium]|nr:ATP-binding cassette domain-containing protein [Acidimicrobiia bacterium]